ncbi:hypothetical protein K438DRAFT_1634873 [Mycena galopus ATCC 62051]|nr:hypothetical protein K438DRAFT_1634873 [Mycena galopus ATCC 62051]
MGAVWGEVVDLWWALEEGEKFPTRTKSHPTTDRPKAVGVWVKNARKGVPDIGTVAEMEKQWWVWWKGINPSWRVRDGELVQMGDGNWDVLRCPGQNGFLNILVCLKWWFLRMDTPSDAWARALVDVKWVLTKMVNA